MRFFTALVLALTLSGCAIRGDGLRKGLTEEELHQVPDIAVLPDDAGWVFSFQFKTRDLTDLELLAILRGVIKRGNEQDDFVFDPAISHKVVIVAMKEKTIDAIATADYGWGQIEIWTGYHDKDWYVKKTLGCVVDDGLEYLRDQQAIDTMKVEQGKASEEIKQFFTPKAECNTAHMRVSKVM